MLVLKNGRESITPQINTPTLSVVALRGPTQDRIQYPLADSLEVVDIRPLGATSLAFGNWV
jgi:hypothetical protein